MTKTGAKRRWGSQPGRERGSISRSESAYIAKMKRAAAAGKKASGNPKATAEWCPSKLDEDERSYWLDAFRRERRG